MISACEKAEQPERALELVGAMEQQDLTPNADTVVAALKLALDGHAGIIEELAAWRDAAPASFERGTVPTSSMREAELDITLQACKAAGIAPTDRVLGFAGFWCASRDNWEAVRAFVRLGRRLAKARSKQPWWITKLLLLRAKQAEPSQRS